MRQSTLKFNLDELDKMKKKLEEAADDLAKCKEQTLSSLEKLKTDWNTTAGEKYTKEIDTDWGDEVDKYIKVINAVGELISEAITQYKTVESEVENLKF